MSQSTLNCSRCTGEMVEGFTVDYGDYGSTRPSDWIEGQPVKSFWCGGAKSTTSKFS